MIKTFTVQLCIFFFCFNVAFADEPCKIKFAVSDNLRPHEFLNKDGEMEGFNILLGKLIAKEMDCQIEFIPSSWKQKLELLETGGADMASFLSSGETTHNYIEIPIHAIVYFWQLSLLSEPVNIKQKTLLINNGFPFEKIIENLYDDWDIIKYENEKAVIQALLKGAGSIAIASSNYVLHFVSAEDKKKIKVVSTPLFNSQMSLVFNKKNQIFAQRVENAIEHLKEDGTYLSILTQAMERKELKPLYKIILYIFSILIIVFIVFFVWTTLLRRAVKNKTISLVEEIERRKETENALEKNNIKCTQVSNWFQTILTSIPEYLCMLDKNMNIIWTNIDDNKNGIPKITYIKDLLCVELEKMVVEGKPFNKRKILYDHKTWEFRGIIVFNGNEPELFLMGNDVTDLVTLRDEAFMTSKLIALGEMALGVAHEINNPIGIIQLNLPMLEEDVLSIISDVKDTPDEFKINEVKNSLSTIKDSVCRIRKIVDDMKVYGSKSSDHYEKLYLPECLETAVSLCWQTIEKCTNYFSIESNKNVPYILGDKKQIEHVIVNIIQNACYALRSKSESIVCKIFYDSAKEFVVIEISDEGIGISKENLSKITTPFFTTRKLTGGTGLGLSIVSRIMKEHGGSLNITSEESHGATISLAFPVHK